MFIFLETQESGSKKVNVSYSYNGSGVQKFVMLCNETYPSSPPVKGRWALERIKPCYSRHVPGVKGQG